MNGYFPNRPEKEIVGLLIQHEESVAVLYECFAGCFPQMKHFWGRLAFEEKVHAQILRKMYEKVESGDICMNNLKFNTTAIQTSLTYVLEQINGATEEDITEVKALSVALDIELAMIEHRFFDVFRTNSVTLQNQFRNLHNQTARHARFLRKYLDEQRLQKAV